MSESRFTGKTLYIGIDFIIKYYELLIRRGELVKRWYMPLYYRVTFDICKQAFLDLSHATSITTKDLSEFITFLQMDHEYYSSRAIYIRSWTFNVEDMISCINKVIKMGPYHLKIRVCIPNEIGFLDQNDPIVVKIHKHFIGLTKKQQQSNNNISINTIIRYNEMLIHSGILYIKDCYYVDFSICKELFLNVLNETKVYGISTNKRISQLNNLLGLLRTRTRNLSKKSNSNKTIWVFRKK